MTHYSSRLQVCELIICWYLTQNETTALSVNGSCNLTPALMFSFFNRRTNPFGESGGSKPETEGKTKILFQCKLKTNFENCSSVFMSSFSPLI